MSAKQYVNVRWTDAAGKQRRHYAVQPTPRQGARLVGYVLVDRNGDELGETFVAYVNDSGVQVRAARWNLKYGWLEIVRRSARGESK